jgi:precorrin-3B C17-methyltransferase
LSGQGRLFIVGLGPGDRAAMTGQALDAIRQADCVVGYDGYFSHITDLVTDKDLVALPLTQERERARLAVARMREGRTVCVISSGDPGVYGMAGLVLERLSGGEEDDVVIVPGVSAVNAAAALLGAPLGHDFAVISLSDLLTPWPMIQRRLSSASEADFVIALLNPKSQKRNWQLGRALEILAEYRRPDTPVGIVRNAYRAGQSVKRTTLADMADSDVDMFTTLIIGNSQTRQIGGSIVTPRGYHPEAAPATSIGPISPLGDEPSTPGKDILAESFRLIEQEIGTHGFGPLEWPIVRRMIHASGDVELSNFVRFSAGAAQAGVEAFRAGTAIVADVRMVAAGIKETCRRRLGVDLHCFLEQNAGCIGDPSPEANVRGSGVALAPAPSNLTRCARAIEQAVAAFPDAVYVIGSAPTALAALCAAVRQGRARPRLIFAMPVGFVGASESKEEALALSVPVIAVRGRRGGSAVAAAAVNAMLLLAVEGGRQ